MYSSAYTVRVIRRCRGLAELVARMGKKRNTYRILDGKVKGKIPFSIPKQG
jgi:hypothetical protein